MKKDRKRLHDGIISPRGEFWNNKTSLPLSRFIEVSVPSQEGDWTNFIT
jgi:hypothetical protein